MSDKRDNKNPDSKVKAAEPQVYKPAAADGVVPEQPREIGGREGPEPVRYGDWEKNGRCIDF